jgi:predicted DNA-binding ArsR family transcriptional regulator
MEPLTETATLRVFNNAGQLVTTRKLAEGTTTVQVVESLASGYYTLAIEKANGIERIKLIIE